MVDLVQGRSGRRKGNGIHKSWAITTSRRFTWGTEVGLCSGW